MMNVLSKVRKSSAKTYFDELLERVRSIRASERRIYQKITDIFQECSIDYHSDSEIRKTFFATVQNKFHFAITNNTAAEIIHSKTDSKKKNMGLATWKNAPEGRILKVRHYHCEKLPRRKRNQTIRTNRFRIF